MDNTHPKLAVFEREIKSKGKRGSKQKKKGHHEESTHSTSLKIYYNNINGLTTKKQSVGLVLDSSTPDIVALCETKLGSKSEPKLPN